MARIRRLAVTGITTFSAVSIAVAGPEHIEGGVDAGSFRGGARTVLKDCPDLTLVRISGSLDGTLRGGTSDLEDMYKIKIVDPANFSVSTRATDCEEIPGGGMVCGAADFDSRLWLFRFDDARGVFGNDDAPAASRTVVAGADGASRLGSAATDGCSQNRTANVCACVDAPEFEAGEYLLAITAGNVPTSGGDPAELIFCFADAAEISGPDGKGGLQAHTAWIPPEARSAVVAGGMAPGDYTLVLTGAEGFGEDCVVIPTVSEWGLITLALLLLAGAKIHFAGHGSVLRDGIGDLARGLTKR